MNFFQIKWSIQYNWCVRQASCYTGNSSSGWISNELFSEQPATTCSFHSQQYWSTGKQYLPFLAEGNVMQGISQMNGTELHVQLWYHERYPYMEE